MNASLPFTASLLFMISILSMMPATHAAEQKLPSSTQVLNDKGLVKENSAQDQALSSQKQNSKRDNQRALVSVITRRANYSPFIKTYRSVGIAETEASVDVENEVSGRVMHVNFSPNQHITSGTSIVALDDQLERIQLRSAKANLSKARESYQRLKSLKKKNSGGVTDLEWLEAQTLVEIAETEVDKVDYELSLKTIKAPISGTLGLSDVKVGAFLPAGSKIVTISDRENLSISLGFPERAASFIKVDKPVNLRTHALAGRVIKGLIEGYEEHIDNQTQTVKVNGAGAEAREAVGWGIVGGLGFATIFTLCLTPVFYNLIVPLTKEPGNWGLALRHDLRSVDAEK